MRDDVVANDAGWSLRCRRVCWWREHLVNDVNNTVARKHIGVGDVGIVDHDRVVGHGERDVIAVERGCNQTVRDIGSFDGTAEYMVREDVNEGLIRFVSVEC